jgi:hypothetical protein
MLLIDMEEPPLQESQHSLTKTHPALLQTTITVPKLLITDFEAFGDGAFVKFWLVLGKVFAEGVPPLLGPMLADCCGVILDVGGLTPVTT